MKKTTVLLLTLSLLLSLALTACGAASSSSDSGGNANQAAPGNNSNAAWNFTAGTVQDFSNNMDMDMIADFPSFAESEVYSDPDAKVIRTAELTIQTTEFDQSVDALAALTAQYGGYYESARVDGGGYYDRYANRTADYVVRIPKENFSAFRDHSSEVGHLYSIQESSDNVGEIYYDTETRLATLKTKQERLLALLEKAELMEDIISLENALADVQYEIDMHTTTLRKYDSLIDYSTFRIQLEEVVKISTEPTPEDSFFTKLGVSFGNGVDGFVNGLESLALWLANNLISLVILAVIVVVGVKIFLWQRKKRSASADQDNS